MFQTADFPFGALLAQQVEGIRTQIRSFFSEIAISLDSLRLGQGFGKGSAGLSKFASIRKQATVWFVMPKEEPKLLTRSANSHVIVSTNVGELRPQVKVGKGVVMGGRMKNSFLKYAR